MARGARVVWCAVGPEELRKCQQWSGQSNGTVTCTTAADTEDCIALVLVGAHPWGSLRRVRVGQRALSKTPGRGHLLRIVGFCLEVTGL